MGAGSSENKAKLSQPAKLELGLGLSLAKNFNHRRKKSARTHWKFSSRAELSYITEDLH